MHLVSRAIPPRSEPPSVRIEQACQALESAWHRHEIGDVTELASFVSTEPPAERREFLIALVAVDLECRWRHGSGKLLDEYVAVYPELISGDGLPPLLVRAEWQAREQSGNAPTEEEYRQRFPHVNLEQVLSPERSAASKPPGGADSAGPVDPYATQPGEYTPRVLGRYTFRRPLAAGGLGVVSIWYDDQLNREVALKEIREDRADDPRYRSRFCAEAELTGLLQHPGVVPIYSMDVNDDGRPYYAMQLITGEQLRDHITSFHRAVERQQEPFAGPQLRQLLQRLIDICNVIHYAHGRGVLHRDLKSANVMLGRYGETLVIDWGLSKASGRNEVDQDGQEVSVASTTERPVALSGSHDCETRDGTALGTVAYAPPEQLSGQTGQIDARSDVYSIGAILYEVLTGHPPCYGMGISEAFRAASTDEIPPPREVNAAVPRPLSAIASKAILADKSRRYQTAGQLRDDLQRWLDDEPVSAHRESAWERLARWTKRHQTLVRSATAALLVITLVSVFAAYRIDAARQEQQQARTEATRLYQLARDATDNLLTRTSDRLSEVPDAADVRQELLRDAVTSYRRMTEVRSDNPELIRESARASIGLANVQRMLEKSADALESLQSAEQTLQRLSGVEAQLLLARVYVERSRLQTDRGELQASRSAIGKALSLTERLASAPVPSTAALLVRGQTLIQRGIVAADLQDDLKAVESFESAAAVLRELLDRTLTPSQQRDVRLQLTRAYNNEAMQRRALESNPRQIIDRYNAAIEQANWLVERHPRDPEVAKEHANALNNFGSYLLDTGELDEARSLYQQSADLFRELSTRQPNVAEFKEHWILAQVGLWRVAQSHPDPQAMKQHAELAAEVADRLLDQNPNRTGFLGAAAYAKAVLGSALLKSDTARAEQLLADAADLVPQSGWDKADELRRFIVQEELTLHGLRLAPERAEGLPQRLERYIATTSSFSSASAAYNTACLICRSCQTLLRAEAEPADVDRYLDEVQRRLEKALEQRPDLWSYASEDPDLSLLRERRPDAWTSLNPKP